MPSTKLAISSLGQITQANIEFGDLTVLVGPQATGKSILLELLKLLVDTGAVLDELKRYGLDWNHDTGKFLDVFLGEGMRSVWREGKSKITFRGEEMDLGKLIGRQKRYKRESLFFIPAQRVLTLGKGWPRPFTDYSPGDPFTVRDFSEKIRKLMESGFGSDESLFPQKQRLKAEIRKLLQETVFSGFGLRVNRHGAQKRLVLSSTGAKDSLPYMVWSAGQREFVPLLMGFYYLLPPTKVSTRDDIKWVVIEELEMGLHPKAISAVMLLVLELLSRGYRVCISTHSPHVLDVVWALKVIQQHNASSRRLLDLFDVDATQNMRYMADEVLKKDARAYYFDPISHDTHDISDLDPGAEERCAVRLGRADGIQRTGGRRGCQCCKRLDGVARTMTFEHALAHTPALKHTYRRGLQGLRSTDRARIVCTQTRNLAGSINLDEALAVTYPHSPRWDYGIGIRKRRGAECIVWVEVHQATARGAEEVCTKHSWLKQWLAASAPLLNDMTSQYVWIASGKVAIPDSSPQRRKLAARGIRFVGRTFRI